jgi:hypothetical protein
MAVKREDLIPQILDLAGIAPLTANSLPPMAQQSISEAKDSSTTTNVN